MKYLETCYSYAIKKNEHTPVLLPHMSLCEIVIILTILLILMPTIKTVFLSIGLLLFDVSKVFLLFFILWAKLVSWQFFSQSWIYSYRFNALGVNSPTRVALHRKWSFPLMISSVNVIKLQFHVDLVTFTEEILNTKPHYLCSVLVSWLNFIRHDGERGVN